MTPVEIARSYLGTRWAHQGRAGHGMDCVGLLVLAFAAYGIQDRTDYGRNPGNGQLERMVAEQFGPPIRKAAMRAGDVVLIGFPRVPRHVAIVGEYAGKLTLIHTYENAGMVVEESIDANWLRMVRYVHRMEASA